MSKEVRLAASASASDAERARRRSILGIDLLEQVAGERAACTAEAMQAVDAGHVESMGAAEVLQREGDVSKAAATWDNRTRSPYYGALQSMVDDLFEDKPEEFSVRRLDVVLAAEAGDLPADLMEVVELLPPGNYSRKRLCTQLNSAIGGHAWGQVYGTVV